MLHTRLVNFTLGGKPEFTHSLAFKESIVNETSIKILKIGTPEMVFIIVPKMVFLGMEFSLQYNIQKMLMKLQTM